MYRPWKAQLWIYSYKLGRQVTIFYHRSCIHLVYRIFPWETIETICNWRWTLLFVDGSEIFHSLCRYKQRTYYRYFRAVVLISCESHMFLFRNDFAETRLSNLAMYYHLWYYQQSNIYWWICDIRIIACYRTDGEEIWRNRRPLSIYDN